MARFPAGNTYFSSVATTMSKRFLKTHSAQRSQLHPHLTQTRDDTTALRMRSRASVGGNAIARSRTDEHTKSQASLVLYSCLAPVHSTSPSSRIDSGTVAAIRLSEPHSMFTIPRGRGDNTGIRFPCRGEHPRGMHRLADVIRNVIHNGEKYTGTQRPGKLSPKRTVSAVQKRPPYVFVYVCMYVCV